MISLAVIEPNVAQSLHTMPRPRSRDFVVTVYRVQPNGELEPDLPERGPCDNRAGLPCRLGIHHHRWRKTGPRIWLVVMRCRVHKGFFTLYPPAYAPYRRQPLVMETPEGDPVRTEGDGRARFEGTLFQGALDAARAVAWHRQHRGTTDRWWTTQLRHLTVTAYLVGVAPELGARERDEIADFLRVDALILHEQAAAIREQSGYRQRGEAVCCILDAIPDGRFLDARLLESGCLTSRWGTPHRWLADTAALRRHPFRSAPDTRRPQRPP